MAEVVLTGIAADVDVQRVHALLINRDPALLDAQSPQYELFKETVRGVSSEIVPIVGADPTAGPIRDMAVWCITLGVATHLESALFPEQQLGDTARAEQLNRRYLGVLADLRSRAAGGSQPRGTFPPAGSWPDPARVRSIPSW